MIKTWRSRVLGALLLVPSASAAGETYYVSPDGTAAWPLCTVATTPCAVETALESAVAGDIVRFLAGIYEPPAATQWEIPAWNPTNSGSADAPITFISDVRLGAEIRDAANAAEEGWAAIGAYQRDHIVWDGFLLRRDKDTGELASSIVNIVEGDENVIRNCEGIGVAHRTHTNGSIISIHSGNGNRIYGNVLHGVTAVSNPIEPVVNASAIWVFDTTNTYVHNNTIYDSNNCISWKTNTNFVNVYQNVVQGCTRAAFFSFPETPGATDMLVHHNVVLDSERFLFTEDAPAAPYHNLRVYNNTVVSSGAMTRGIFYGEAGGEQHGQGTELFNNIFVTAASTRFVEIHDDVDPTTFPVTLDYNAYFVAAGSATFDHNQTLHTGLPAWQAALDTLGASQREDHSIEADPLFVNPGGAAAEDYRLQTSPTPSPAIGAGLGGIDMGAFDGDPCIGAGCDFAARPPAAPSALTVG